MPAPLTKPQLYRLTLKSEAAVVAFCQLLANQKPPRLGVGVSRPDGKYDVGISMSLLDQLQTASLPKENLSDTLLRIMAKGSAQ
jgi:hypothetical protein